MSIEFYIYLFISIFCVFYISKEKIKYEPFIVLITALILLSLIRQVGLGGDFGRYVDIMQLGPERFVRYWHREFIFWLSLHHLFVINKSIYTTLLVLDGILLFTLCYTFYRYRGNNALTYIIMLLLSFPFFLGSQNIYRQCFAMTFFIAAYLTRPNNSLKSDLLFMIAFFNHNYIAVFYPILVTRGFYLLKPNKAIMLGLFGIITLPILIAALSTMESNLLRSGVGTGYNLSILYILFISLICLYFIFLSKSEKYLIQKSPSTIAALVTLPLFFCMGMEDNIIERLGMTYLAIIIIDLVDHPPKSKIISIKTYRKLLLIVFTAPVFLFPSSRSMLNDIKTVDLRYNTNTAPFIPAIVYPL